VTRGRRFFSALVVFALAGCGGTLDAGRNASHGPLPVDERNPIILENDGWSDNWVGEFAALFANDRGPPLAGIIGRASTYWPDVNANVDGWTRFVKAARASGLTNLPDVTASVGAELTRPPDGEIDSTVPNRSGGAQRIIDLSLELATPQRPVVVLACAPLTDVADAYLMDPAVVDRVVVVAPLGAAQPTKAFMTGPNGDLDPWADWIVAHRFRYVQVSAYYDQTGDVTTAQLDALAASQLKDWIAAKRPNVFTIPTASDQIAVLSVSLPNFAVSVTRASPDPAAQFGNPANQGPVLLPDQNGNAWIVTKIAPPLASSELWRMLIEKLAQ
jgi:hypothetical protein